MIENEPPLATHEAMDPLDVCTLDPDEFADRLRWIREKTLRHALGKERLEDGIAIEVSNAPGMSERIDHWIGFGALVGAGLGWLWLGRRGGAES